MTITDAFDSLHSVQLGNTHALWKNMPGRLVCGLAQEEC